MSDDHSAKRRKVRKGTHSCWECRRRKVKCIFAAPGGTICISCTRRRSRCVSQGALDGSCGPELPRNDQNDGYTMTEARRRALITPSTSQQSSPMVSYDDSATSSTNAESRAILQSHDSHSLSVAQPQLGVCEPGVPYTSIPENRQRSESSTLMKLREALLDAFPSKDEITILLARAEHFYALCSRISYTKRRELTDEDLINSQKSLHGLLDPDTHPVLLCQQILLFVASLSHLSVKEVIPGLHKHHHEILEDLAEAAISLVNMRDSLVGSLEGLENLILESFYHIDSGNIRRAWMTIRRAISIGQILGVQDPCGHRFKRVRSDDDLDPASMWTFILSLNGILSLLLGMPSDASISNHTSHNFADNFCTLSAKFSGQILEHNQIRDYEKSVAVTQQIDRELVDASESMPTEFWRPPSFAGLDLKSVATFVEVQRIWFHMSFYAFIIQLHLPYILCAVQTPQRDYSRDACQNASREVLGRQITMRSSESNIPCCRLGNFMALIAGLTLSLTHILSHHDDNCNSILAHQRAADRAIIVEALQFKPNHEATVLETKCARLLQELLAIEAEASHARTHKPSDNGLTRKVLAINVPYVGIVHVGSDGIAAAPLVAGAVDQEPHSGLQVGGFGSMRVIDGNIARTAARSNVSQGHTPCSTAPSVTTPADLEGSDVFGQFDQFFPDAAASSNDWTFQGTDTAFFDSLFRGFEQPSTS
ncbi:hypothetical protein OPT61_g7118 [Boeremia exigua]|uniref:Uncharacterized protein n=1 Tax=Boeremia exigua TaxID=749465 RepID=A0ACC2I3W0_9PLEO|nr:hypothetical protein OPT61_g7118 [Boeremia exigua]